MQGRPEGEIERNLRAVRARIAAAAERAGRRPDAVTLVAVSKTMPAERVAAAVRAGVDVLGENRVQEAEAKEPAVRELLGAAHAAPAWHLIGHLQTNKVKAAVGLFQLIESVDSLRLAEALDRRAGELGIACPVLLQVNVAGEETKGGFAPEELRRAAAGLARLEHLTFAGVMTIAPLTEDSGVQHDVFGRLRALFDDLRGTFAAPAWRHLSMGMSNDFEVAIAEGATLVRIGRAIFGERA